ncbi:regulator of telomere elongation helicase 1 isoform X2 [Esox lucius]|uniref:Regulator of telomere elongation helicase 1 n=1 Tax=Esox lucius TaxID=8010 RepID=A0A3P8XC23_ESOLU|nr:regulator of telomere elongation helicase 1 isoform X2 [Esox lucius]
MPPLVLKGITVDFPFTPYECQKDYMNKVIECLQNKVNGVLESPTGTGKTMCLLCATLAWRNYFKDTISARKIAEKMGGAELFPNTPMASWGTAATDGETTTYYTDIPKIIYASRTHSQLTQVINELKNTSYRPKVCVLGSREQLCINPEVMRQESNHIKVHMCRAKISTRSCMFYNNVEEKSTDKDLVNSILDVEDLVKAGNKQRVCPYYLSRSLKQQADIIFMPYNYLLDPKSRRAHNIELKGAVIIFDEAHNVEKMCEESTSFDLTPYDLASAIDAVDKLLAEQAKEAGRGDVSEDFNVESLNAGLKLDITTIAKIKQILLDLEMAIDSYEVPGDKGITKPGSFIFELFQRAHLTFDTKTAIFEALEQITGYLAGKPGIFMNTTGLQKLADIIQLVFCIDSQEEGKGANIPPNMKPNTTQFKVHIHKDTSYHKKKLNTDVWNSSSSKKQGNVLSYWCFSPGFSMQELVRQGVRSIILTSGTLSPMSSFTSEMQIPFPVCLENPHVIQNDQIFVSIIDRGPDSVQLSSAFDRRFVPENMTSLGNTVVNLSRVVPHGLLVFFPSYPVMDKTLEFWRANGHADRIENIKPMFVEPRGKGTFTEIIHGYYDKVNDSKSKGGSFFAVCRGKASEGLDFADTYGRGVIITGLPFPPRMDPRVILKMQYLDEMSRKKTPGVQYLSGQNWYKQQASRAVNQAIGRVIRHREDYGAIFLCDHRFKSIDARAQLPSWVRPYVRTYDNFGNMVRDVAQFFRVAQKLRPPPEMTPGKGSCVGAVRSADPHCASARPCSSSQGFNQGGFAQKAKVLDSHVPSLKKRRLNECGGSEGNGMASLCIEYETEMEAGRRRPVGLLDALEHSDHRHGEDQGQAGEERANRFSTLSLQYDKRMEDELRGGKRKIKVVQERKTAITADITPEEGKAGKAKIFLAVMKKSLSQMNFQRVMAALQAYKQTDDLDKLLAEAADLFTGDTNTHSLLRGFYQFIRPHHKKLFDEKCVELTGLGCGYKPGHSLSKEEKEMLMLSGVTLDSSTSCSQLNASHQLNKGGYHLGSHGLASEDHVQKNQVLTVDPKCKGQAPVNSTQKNQIYANFITDVKNSIGLEKSNQLFSAIQSYKKTDSYESLVGTVVSLLTEKNEDFNLLSTFALFIRPHHKKQYKEMLDALIGDLGSSASSEISTRLMQVSAPGNLQKKISSYFPSSQRD